MKTSPVDSNNTTAEPSSPSLTRRLTFFTVFGAALIGIVALTAVLVINDINSRLNAPRHDSKALLPGISVAPFVTLPDEGIFPVGLTQDADGTFYLSLFGTGAIKKIDAKGAQTPFINPEGAIRAGGPLVIGPDKALYIVDFSEKTKNAVGQIKRITPDGKVTNFVSLPDGKGLPLFAQMTFDDAGNLYVTDPNGGRIWQFTPDGSPSLWWTAAAVGSSKPQLTGIAFDPAHKALIVSDVGTGTIYRVDLAGDIHRSATLYQKTGLDVRALTLDDEGRVLLAIWQNENGILGRLDADGQLIKLADGFRAPTAIVYWDGKAYIVNSDLPGILQQIKAKPPFTVDVVDLSNLSAASTITR